MKVQLQNEILGALETLPEEADLEDVIRALQVKVRITRGINDLNAGRTTTSENLLERYRTKFSI